MVREAADPGANERNGVLVENGRVSREKREKRIVDAVKFIKLRAYVLGRN